MGVFKRQRINSKGKKSEFWYIRYSVNGKDKWELVGKVGQVTKDIALARLAERKKQLRLGQLDMLKTTIPTLREFSRDYMVYQREVKFKRSWKKDEAHLRIFNSLFGDKKLSEITAKDIDDYKQKRLQEVKPVTVNRELEVLRHLFYLAKKWKKFFGDNPVSESGLLKTESQRIRVLTLDEEARLMNSSSEHLYPIIKTALMTGMRQGEILSLKWEDVNFGNNLITIRAEISKSKKNRRIPISSSLRTLLLEQKIKTISTGYVFVTPEAIPYSPNNPSALKRTFTTARNKAKVENFTFHDLRHTAATRMAENGANIIAVKEILGHADIKTTMKYFHPGDSLIKAVEILANYK
ncbi:MAG: tyrosine-type recombinase/integrase [Deltaproteobacteria bacterium]